MILRAGEGGTVADALEALVRQESLPPRDKIEEADALALLSHGWLDSKLRDGTKVRHAVGFRLNQASDAPALMKWLAAQIERNPHSDTSLVKRLRETASAMFADVDPKKIGRTCVSHIQRPVAPLLVGDMDAWLAARHARLRVGASRLSDGYRVWKPKAGARYDYGETLGAADCNGYTAMAMEELLVDATWSGDEGVIARALSALDKAIARYEGTVPRGAQPWEMPLHTPDIVASGLMVRCCALGYLLKPEARYLKAARYWAYTGLSMVYAFRIPRSRRAIRLLRHVRRDGRDAMGSRKLDGASRAMVRTRLFRRALRLPQALQARRGGVLEEDRRRQRRIWRKAVASCERTGCAGPAAGFRLH